MSMVHVFSLRTRWCHEHYREQSCIMRLYVYWLVEAKDHCSHSVCISYLFTYNFLAVAWIGGGGYCVVAI